MRKNQIINFTLIISILIFGSLFRLYNINFDDFWYDEILSFTAANPNLSIIDSFKIQTEIDNTPYLGSFFLRFFFKIFGYNPEVARYLPSIFSIASIFTVSYLAKTLKNNYSYIFVGFLVATNIFLISYSQELRIYSMLFFFSSLSFLFFIKLIKEKNNIYICFFFILFSSLQVLSHPISFTIIISYILYISLNYFVYKKENLSLNLSILATLIICLLYFVFYFKNYTIHSWDWINQPSIKFYTNFYFSNFFGSRLVGLVHLILFIYLVYLNRKLFIKLDKISIFLIIIILSYLLPILFGYMHKPILISRYIIFLIAPIIILISYFTFEIKNKKKRNIIISMICFLTIANLLTEQTTKQFFQIRHIHKPEFKKAVKILEKSDTNKYYFKINSFSETAPAPGSPETIVALYKYFSLLNKDSDKKIIYENINSTTVKKIWIICLMDLHGFDCSLPPKIKDNEIIENINLNRLNLKLITL